MKRARLFFMVMLAMLSAGSCSWEKENNGNNSGENGGETPGGGASVEWVDLGLPSGRLWATCNLGATKPEEYGDYYAWGETTPKSVYDRSTYRYARYDSKRSGYYLTKYCNYSSNGYNGFTDTLTVLEAMDDAATAKLGSGARMPTRADWEELINNTTSEWITVNDVSGRKFTAANGKSLFLPAAGWRVGSSLGVDGSYGYYWYLSLDTDDPNFALGCDFDSTLVLVDNNYYWFYRYLGLTVRAVR